MSLFHFFSNLISSLEISYAAAEMTASLRNECPEKFEASMPARSKSSLIFPMRKDRLNGPSASEKRESSSCLSYARSSMKKALTGQRMEIA